MLKKLNFSIKTFNISNHELNVDTYHEYILDTYYNTYLYTFNFDYPCYVHVVDDKGNCYWCYKLIYSPTWSYKIKDSYNYVDLATYYSKKHSYKVLKKEVYIMLYISQTYTPVVDIEYSMNCMNESLRELRKMHRDISWFDNEK